MQVRSQLAAASAALLVGFSAQAAVITQWNFNSVPPDAANATGTTTPSTGLGSIGVIGGVTSAFGSGNANGGSTDPDATSDDSGYQTTGYPAAGVGNKSAGIQFAVGTSGYEDIVVSWDQRHSNSSSKNVRLQYTLDITAGTPVWVDDAAFVAGLGGDTWYNGRSSSFAAVPALDNNPNAAFRVDSEFDSAAGAYVGTTTGTNYATTGTWRFDMVTVSGSVIPEPASLSLLAATALIGRRRKI